MAQVDAGARTVNCKVVYYGPGRSGKTTNLEVIHTKTPEDGRGELVSITTGDDRTLYFDLLPLRLGEVAGLKTKFQLYTVPGQVYYNATRQLVLKGADGVVFVADSDPARRAENIESVENLVENLKRDGIDIEKMPIFFQWNKRDLPDAMPPEQMNADLNRWDAPATEATAITGDGVFPALRALVRLVLDALSS